MKKLLICLSLFCSILFLNIEKINAYTYKGVEINQSFFNKGWELLEGTNNGGSTYFQSDFPLVYIQYGYSSDEIFAYFITDFTFQNYSTSTRAVGFSSSKFYDYKFIPGFAYNTSTKEYRTISTNVQVIPFYTKTAKANFDVYDNNNSLLYAKAFDYTPPNNSYDNSKWLDISNFSLPIGITKEEYNIVIFYSENDRKYKMFAWSKNNSNDIHLNISDNDFYSNTFPYGNFMFFYDKNMNKIKVNYYEEVEPLTKIFKDSPSGSSDGSENIFKNFTIIYSNTNLYSYLNNQKQVWFYNDKLENELKKKYKINFNLNGGKIFNENIDCYETSCSLPFWQHDDFYINLDTEKVNNYIRNLKVEKDNFNFEGWYYDEKLTKPYNIDDIITNDINLYAKYSYKDVNEFLKNTTFIDYTFDTNYEYAIITKGANLGDIYLGLNYMTYNLELYEYNKNNASYKDGATLCLTPYYSKDEIYYYVMKAELYNNIELLVIPREKLEVDDKTYYNFKLSDNAHITYTNDLTKVEIYDDNDNKIETDLSDSYEYSQDALLNDENDLIGIFKDNFKLKDSKIFKYFEQIWNLFKKSELYKYFIILITGSLIILIIKAAKRS